MTTSKHTFDLDTDLELEITGISIRDAFSAREKLLIRLEEPENKGADPKKVVYARVMLITDNLNGAFESLCTAIPKIAVETKGMSAKQVRHYFHKYLREDDCPHWGAIGTIVGCRIAEGRINPDTNERYPDTVFMNSLIRDNLLDEDLDAILHATDYFAPTNDSTDSPAEEVEEILS